MVDCWTPWRGRIAILRALRPQNDIAMLSLLLLFFSISIVFSFLCSMWEAVLLSITPTYAEIENQKGTDLGKTLRAFKEDIDLPLSAILTLNTIAHTVGAIGVGAQATQIWAESNPWITQLAVPAAMTLAILVLSEIIPKTIGAVHWKRLVPFTVHSLTLMMKLLAPLVWVSQRITRLIKPDVDGSVLSRSDFLAMTRIGAKQGVFEQQESEIITNLLRFERVTAEAIMTPRTVVVMAAEEMSISAFHAQHETLHYSRIPTFQSDSRDLVTGFVLKDQILERLVADAGDDLIQTLRRDIMVIPEAFPLPDLFTRFMNRQEHIAVVVDDFGGMSGIVTMEDVIETLLGLEIVDETDAAEDMQNQARAQWRNRARARGLVVEDLP